MGEEGERGEEERRKPFLAKGRLPIARWWVSSRWLRDAKWEKFTPIISFFRPLGENLESRKNTEKYKKCSIFSHPSFLLTQS